jgi:hypothetical protein
MFCRSLFVLLYFFFGPLCCLYFFDMRILITPWYLQTLLLFVWNWHLSKCWYIFVYCDHTDNMRYQCYHMHDYDLMANTKTDRERCHLDLYVNPSTYILLIPFCVHKIFQIVSLSCQRLGLLCTFHNMSVIYKDCQLYWRRKP